MAAIDRPTYTRGPWTVTTYVSPNGRVAYVKADTGHQEICVLYDDEQQLENAHVIAQTPAMIDLLDEVLEFLDNYVDVVDGEDGQPRPNRAMSLTTSIQQVLEKAGVRR